MCVSASLIHANDVIQEDFGRMPAQLIHVGVDFLVQNNLGPRRKVSGSLVSVHTRRRTGRSVENRGDICSQILYRISHLQTSSFVQAYVHCKAGRGRSAAVVLAYMVVRDMMACESEDRQRREGPEAAASEPLATHGAAPAAHGPCMQPPSQQCVVRLTLLDAFLHLLRSRG